MSGGEQNMNGRLEKEDIADVRARLAASDWSGVLQCCNELLPDFQDNPFLLSSAHKAAIQLGALEDARSYIGSALAVAPKTAAYHLLSGRLHQRQGELDAAFLAYRKAAELAPEVASYHASIAAVNYSQENYPGAIAHYQLALSIDPMQASWWNRLARCATLTDNFALAVEAYKKSLALNDHENIKTALEAVIGFAPGFMEQLHERDGNQPRQRIYLLGCGRSGTWLALGAMNCFLDTYVLLEEVPLGRFAKIDAQEKVHVLKRRHDAYLFAIRIPHEIKLLYVIRFPLDVLVSSHNDKERYITPERWLGEMAALKMLIDSQRPDMFIMRYEDMVSNPKAMQARIADFFGLKPSRSFTELHTQMCVNKFVESAMHGLRAPDTDSVGNWRNTKNVEYLRAIWPEISRTVDWVCDAFDYDRPDDFEK